MELPNQVIQESDKKGVKIICKNQELVEKKGTVRIGETKIKPLRNRTKVLKRDRKSNAEIRRLIGFVKGAF